MRNFLGEQSDGFRRARRLVRIYYAVLLVFPLCSLGDWPGLLRRETLAPLWPVAWLPLAGARFGVGAILALYLGGALLGALFPAHRWARALAFLGLFEFVAFNNSLGKIGHSMHLWVLTACVLIFLPNEWQTARRVVRQKFLLVFWSAQAVVLLVYSMSGLGKICGAIYQLTRGQANLFQPDALARIVAERLQQTHSQSLLGPWLAAHPLAGWPLMLGEIALTLLAFPVAFRPAFHRLWAIGLILFHLATYLFLTINFAPAALLVAILLLFSPFAIRRQCAS